MSLVAILLPVILTFVAALVIVAVVRSKVRGVMGGIPSAETLGGMFGGADSGKAAQAQALQAHGRKARAHIVSIQPTGVILNQIILQLHAGFRLEPLDGGPGWDAQKTIAVAQSSIPRIGDVWPAWIDPTDPTVFAVGAPQAMTPELLAIYREFGIAAPGAIPGDPTAMPPAATPPPPASPSPPPPPQPAGADTERIEALERLARLHNDGLLTAEEFAAEKARLLGA